MPVPPPPRALSMPPTAEESAANAAREAVARAHLPALFSRAGGTPERVSLLTVPGFPIALSPPSAERRDKFRAHIVALLEESAVPGDTGEHESHLPPTPVLAASCALCRGLCCRHGGDEAHIDAAAVHGARASRPLLSGDQLVALYTDAIPALTVESSCILHGERGCGLPRELRSQTCNEFHCVPLRQWQERERLGTDAAPTAVVVVQGDQVLRSGLLCG